MAVAYKYIIRPYIQFRKYVKYGEGEFYPMTGEQRQQLASFRTHGDLEYKYKHMHDKQGGELRVYVDNISSSVKVKLCHPELVRDFFSKINECYVNDMFFVQNFERLFGKGLVFASGEQWKRTRLMLSPAFHFNYVNNLSEMIENLTDAALQKIVDRKNFEKVDTIKMMSEITAQVIIFFFFGSTLSEVTFRGENLANAITYIVQKIAFETGSLTYRLFGSKALLLGLFKEHRDTERYLQEFKSLLNTIIKQRIEQLTKEFEETGEIKATCVLSVLIKLGNINNMTQKELLDNFWTLFIAGTESTSHLAGMTTYFLSQRRDFLLDLQKEIDENKNTTSQGLLELPLLNAALKETLRFYGPGNMVFHRVATKDHMLGDIKIEKGVVVTILGHALHRNPKYYKDPHTYNPYRWVNGETNNLPGYCFVPFSGGARNCIGQHLSMIEARIMLSKFIKMFDFSLQDNYKLKLFFALVPQPIIPLQINLKQRQ